MSLDDSAHAILTVFLNWKAHYGVATLALDMGVSHSNRRYILF